MYSARDVAQLLGLTEAQVRAWVRAGFLSPARDGQGRLTFSFQDLVLLRTAKGLLDADIAPRRVKTALRKLKAQLPEGRPLASVAIAAEDGRVVVRDGRARWTPEDGQALLDFQVAELATQVAPLVKRSAQQAKQEEAGQSAQDWYELGFALEVCSPQEARDAYRRAIELEPAHVDAHVNLGRLLHEAGELAAAETHYRLALAADERSSLAAFNLGVVLEDEGHAAEAMASYQRALELDPQYADAHFNLARLYEKSGKPMAALRHLRTYQKLTRGRT